ncbi:MAG: UDP-N-acetylmuramoyl-tripeptide--D-alanyl-D-alanine ligase [Clostridia bacterium]|nr:UDP-N-acetylmuramoyl-tripeptide--D-alanyl-D-alanine ligase [Clostridia bacterium]
MAFARGDWFFVVMVFLTSFFMTRPYLYAIQQDNYRITEIFKNRRLRFVYLIDLCSVILFVGVWCGFYFVQAKAFFGFLTALFFFVAEFAMYFMEDLPTRKKPLKYTKRAVRCLLFVSIFGTALVSVALAVANVHTCDVYLRYLIFFGYPLVFPLVFIVGGNIINVFERVNNKGYELRSARILKSMRELEKIAITGSFGKTSVKNYLTSILKQKYNVLATPKSFNTPMGISLATKELDETYDCFIAEFGARRVGDIKKLMKIVKPNLTVLTGINEQHLETFRSKENIIKEKCRILEVGEGVCVVNDELREIVQEKLRGGKTQVIYAGFDENSVIRAENIAVSEAGSTFDLCIGGEKYSVSTSLLGIHNVKNILLSVGVAYALGVEMPYILRGVENLETVPHRMELIHGNGINIIDDSFNGNPTGAKCALDTLALFDTRKVVLTPGLVELGKEEGAINYELGQKIAEVADLVLLVGFKRTDTIKRGLIEAGYGGEIHIYKSLASAEEDFENRLKVGDTLLILNDLPDIYDEKS